MMEPISHNILPQPNPSLSSNEVGRSLSAKLAELLHRIEPVRSQAILFGSRARGTARPDSDWDVLILLDKDRISASDHDNISYPLRELGWEINQMINPILFTKREWESKHSTLFYKNVMTEGIALTEKIKQTTIYN